MGSGIAYACASNGYQVKLVEQNAELLQLGIRKIEELVRAGVEKGKISADQASDINARVKGMLQLRDAAQDADLLLEAVYEDLDLKKKIFTQAREVCPSKTILATNTSSLSIAELASASTHPDRFLGIHFFNPPAAMKLVEIVQGPDTSQATVEIAKAFVESLGKQWVLAKDSPGFIVNRLLIPMLNEAACIVQGQIASIEDVDKAMVIGAGMPIGPLALSDIIGIDILQSIMENLERKLGSKYSPCPLLREKVRNKQLGKKSGLGYYNYVEKRS